MSQKTSSKAPSPRRDRGSPQIFLCDPSAEAGRLLSALQGRGYSILDVPLGMLLNRCRYESPQLVICDAEALEVKATLTELAQLENDAPVLVVLLGNEEGNLDRDAELVALASATFRRPLALEETTDALAELCGPPARRTSRPRIGRTSRAPSLVTAARKPYRSDVGSSPPSMPTEELAETSWPIDSPPSRGPLSPDIHVSIGSDRPESSLSSRPTTSPPSSNRAKLSPETASVLEAGKRRLETYPRQSSRPVRLSLNTATDNVELRPELLEALLDPLDDAEYGSSHEHPAQEKTSPGTRNTGPESTPKTNAGLKTSAGSTGTDAAKADSQPSSELAAGLSGDIGPDTAQPQSMATQRHRLGAELSDEERTNPGGKPPTHPPPHDAEHEGAEARPALPPLDDLSDLLSSGAGWAGAKHAQQMALTTPPPLRRGTGRGIDELESDLPGSLQAPSLPASLFQVDASLSLHDADLGNPTRLSVPQHEGGAAEPLVTRRPGRPPQASDEEHPPHSSAAERQRALEQAAHQPLPEAYLARPDVARSGVEPAGTTSALAGGMQAFGAQGWGAPHDTRREHGHERHLQAASRGGEPAGHAQAAQPLAPAATSLLALLAEMIAKRQSGAVAQQERGGVRRVVVTDGDLSTVVSGLPDESLSHFLHERGDFSTELLGSLSAIPNYGRHAGAALIARGLLQQEDLWPVLRSHAEWILARALVSRQPAMFEATVPGRLQEEPAVFGGAAGTEIFIESVRRTIAPQFALDQLGGPDQILGWGTHQALLAESALSPAQQQAVIDSLGHPLARLLPAQPYLLPIIYGLSCLGALSGQRATPDTVAPAAPKLEVRNQELEEEAFLTRFKARRALVEQGDYFAILGVARSATSYEVDRARDELLEQFQEARLLPHNSELLDELQLLRATISEAHLVLSDEVRRMRYRTALEAMPR